MIRDHLKIIRKVIADLDVTGRRYELQPAPHPLEKLIRALPSCAGTVAGEAVVVSSMSTSIKLPRHPSSSRRAARSYVGA